MVESIRCFAKVEGCNEGDIGTDRGDPGRVSCPSLSTEPDEVGNQKVKNKRANVVNKSKMGE